MNLKSQNLWKRAKEIIPGGTQLLSKRPEMFLPEYWPTYYNSAKGVEVVDLDGNTFVDMSLMGVGACVLGYADSEVNKAIKEVVDKGNMSTLNSPEEVELAELLLDIHPWADMVRYARTGGEAMAVAVRLARGYVKKDIIAFCGYHGWHDWYLSSNLSGEEKLVGHLLPGLSPLGVNKNLLDTAFPFNYNRIEELEEIVKNRDVGVIVMEPSRHHEPKDNFLHKVREIADKIGAVLIFDEVSSGFRQNVGGVHLIYGVNPDIAVFGKAISNGYPMSAIIGREDIMEVAQNSFISSTYWTERIGPTAAVATIHKMQKEKVPDHLDKIGRMIDCGWRDLANKNNIHIEILGPNPLVTFSFIYDNAQEIKTLFTQQMLEFGFLASTAVYVSYCHTEEHVKKYLLAVDETFKIISRAIKENNVTNLLKGPVAHNGFKRLT